MDWKKILGGAFVLAACTLEPIDEPVWVTAACEEHEFVQGDRDHENLVYDCDATRWVPVAIWEEGDK